MIKYKVYEFYPGLGNDDRLALPDEKLQERFDSLKGAIEAIKAYGGKQEYAIITTFRIGITDAD